MGEFGTADSNFLSNWIPKLLVAVKESIGDYGTKRAPTAGCRGSRSPKGKSNDWGGARRETNYIRLIKLPPNPMGGLPEI